MLTVRDVALMDWDFRIPPDVVRLVNAAMHRDSRLVSMLVSRGLDIDDVRQHLLLVVWQFVRSKPESTLSISSVVYPLCRNRLKDLLDHCHAKKRYQELLPLDEALHVPDSSCDPERFVIANLLEEGLRQYLYSRFPRHADRFWKVIADGYTMREAGISASTFHTIRRACRLYFHSLLK